jgi:predicted transcriptional regulator
MVAKQAAKHVIDAMPDDASMDDIIHALYVRAKFEHGERQIREGRGVPHKKVKERLGKWLR